MNIQADSNDIILRGGSVYDGAGGPPYSADLLIRGDSILHIGELSEELIRSSARIIDVAGLAVSPGFIDIHTHSDFSVLTNRRMTSSVAQGVTMEVAGNCGTSIGLLTAAQAFTQERRWAERGGIVADWTRMAEWMTRVESEGIGINLAVLAGHGTIRKGVMEFANRPPDADELLRMQNRLTEALDDGAVGFSTGLEYLPGAYAGVEEQGALAKIAAMAGGFYATHMRNEGDQLIESVSESIEVARLGNASLQISHHKAEGRANWGKIDTTLKMMAQARAEGMDVLTDMYPYTAFMTGLGIIVLPKWANDGTSGDMVARLRDPLLRPRIALEIDSAQFDWDAIQIGIARNRPETQGLSLSALGRSVGKSPVEAALDLLVDEEGWVAAVHFAMSEDDLNAVFQDPHTMIGSDGVGQTVDGPLAADKTHPRTFGTFPRVLGRYVRQRSVLSLSEAVRRMTSLPASRLRLADRGKLAVGYKADIAVFDPGLIDDCATFDDPHQLPVGIRHVLVNGRFVIHEGVASGELPGRVIRRS